MINPIKPKKCKNCGKLFSPYRTTQVCCYGVTCALEYAQKAREKRERKANREARQKLKTKSELLKETQAVVNKYIRLRDQNRPCISCGRYHTGQYHAGHYRSVGAAPELRFVEDNIHKQCAPCNNHKSGNAIEYRINLVNKIGIERVEFLEGPHQPKKYTVEEIGLIKSLYKFKIRELEAKAA